VLTLSFFKGFLDNTTGFFMASPGFPFNVSDGQVSQYMQRDYVPYIHNEHHTADNQTAVLLFSRKLQTHYLLVFNIPFSYFILFYQI